MKGNIMTTIDTMHTREGCKVVTRTSQCPATAEIEQEIILSTDMGEARLTLGELMLLNGDNDAIA